MGTKDIVCKQYMRNEPEVIRDLIRLVQPNLALGDLKEMNPEEALVMFASHGGLRKDDLSTVARFRDLLSSAHVQGVTDDTTDFVIVGIENQDYVDWAMPVRVMLANALDYAWQIERIRKAHAAGSDETGKYPREFLSGLQPGDRLHPVITIVVYWSDKEWTGPKQLRDILHVPSGFDPEAVDSSPLHIVQPALLSDEQLQGFDSSLQQVFRFIRAAGNKTRLQETIQQDEKFQHMSPDAVHVLEQVTKISFGLKNYAEGDGIDMCQGIADLIADGCKLERTRADEERARADEEHARADEERARADEERARADKERARADEQRDRADKLQRENEERRREYEELRNRNADAVNALKNAARRLADARMTTAQIAGVLGQTEAQVTEWLALPA